MKINILITILLLFIFSKNINAQLHINSGATIKTSGNVILTLQDIDLNNEGTLETSLGSTVVLKENNATSKQNFGGNGTFNLYDLTIERNSFDAQLTTSIDIKGDLNFSSGKLDLNSHNITLINNGKITNESESSRLIGPNGGVIMKSFYLFQPSAENIGNLGAEITSNADLGWTTIKRGHVPRVLPAGNDFERYYEISPSNNSGLNATLKLYYLDAENISLPELNLELWELSPTNGWTQRDATGRNANTDFIRTNGIDEFATWTFAGANDLDNDGDGLSILEGDCDDTNPVEVVDTVLNNIPIDENYYIVSNQITSAGTVQANETMTFQAGVDIILQNGFIANEGTNFKAFLVECGVPPAPFNAITNNSLSDENQEISESENETLSTSNSNSNVFNQYRVFPNPITDQAVVEIEIEQTMNTEILLTNNIGQILKQISPNKIIVSGKHSFSFQVDDLPEGIYFVRIKLDEKFYTEKVVVMKRN